MDRRIELVINKIDSDPGAWEFADLAALVNLSKSRLRHLFKQETGTTLAKYLKRSRLQRSELLLRTTFLAVKEIVGQSGLTSDSHFVRDFKKAYGMSPMTYRRLKGLTKKPPRNRRK